MPLKKNSPGCRCCSTTPCNDWSGSPQDEIQLTLPAGCQRAGTYVLDRTDTEYILDCPTSTLGGFTFLCAGWRLVVGSGPSANQLYVNVGIRSNGDTIIIAGICCAEGSITGTDAGTLWGMVAAISDWDDMDGLSLPFTNRVTDTDGLGDCSTDDPCSLSFVP